MVTEEGCLEWNKKNSLITEYDEDVGKYQIRFSTPEELCESLTDSLIDLVKYCKSECHIDTVVISTLAGISLSA